MSVISTFIKTLSASAVILAGVSILGIKGKMEKPFKYALALFSVSVIIFAAVGALKGDMNFEFKESKSASLDTAQNINNTNVEYIIGDLLLKNGILFNEIEVITDNFEKDSISIIKVFVSLKSSEDFDRAYSLIFKETGIKIAEG